MSITTDEPPLERLDPTTVWERNILHNPEICSSCFRRIRDREELDTDSWGSGNAPGEVLTRIGDGVVGHDSRSVDEYGAVQQYFTRTFCGGCGQPGGRLDDDTISLFRALRRCPRLITRLEEQGLPVYHRAVYLNVMVHKRNKSLQGHDTEIFEAAVTSGVRHGIKRAVRE
jgi:hypothetical protein